MMKKDDAWQLFENNAPMGLGADTLFAFFLTFLGQPVFVLIVCSRSEVVERMLLPQWEGLPRSPLLHNWTSMKRLGAPVPHSS